MEKAAFKLDGYHYDLVFDVVVGCSETNTEVIRVSCEASFSSGNKISITEIPDYFYRNCLAIVFPYIIQATKE